MLIVDPGGFDALDLLAFQINPHYTNAMPAGHQGETREQRLAEFVTANPDVPVLGLPEGDWLTVDDGAATLCGPKDAVCIRHAATARFITIDVTPEPIVGSCPHLSRLSDCQRLSRLSRLVVDHAHSFKAQRLAFAPSPGLLYAACSALT